MVFRFSSGRQYGIVKPWSDGMICNLCPRKCNAKRTEYTGGGFCRAGTLPVIARAAPHFGEEPCISGTKGSGTIFFSGCTLRCVYCQNYEISRLGKGTAITPRRLAEYYKQLEDTGVHNINLVTATHFTEAILASFQIYKPDVPIVFNCGGYETTETLKKLEGLVDVYLPDFKYADDALAETCSRAGNYKHTALLAVSEMVRQTGTPVFDSEGLIQKGVIVRHLVLPSHTKNSIGVIDALAERFSGQILFSLMAQYTPTEYTRSIERLNRKITNREYAKVTAHLLDSGLDGFTQDLSSAHIKYIPKWDI